MVVELTKNKYMICDRDKKTRDLLRKHCFSTGDYARTTVFNTINGKRKQTSKRFHQLYLDYEEKKSLTSNDSFILNIKKIKKKIS